LQEGVRYTFAQPLLRTLIAVPAVAALFGTAYATLLPAWAVEVLGGNAATNGLLQSARGAGSLLGALMIAALGYAGRRGRWLTIGTFVYPCSARLCGCPHGAAVLGHARRRRLGRHGDFQHGQHAGADARVGCVARPRE